MKITTSISPATALIIILHVLLPTSRAATITWDAGGGDKSWHNPNNWSGDLLPGQGDDVVVDTPNAQIEVISSVSIAAMRFSSGVLLRVQGPATTFLAASNTIVNGSSIVALQGATVRLPAMTNYNLPDIQSIKAVWKADGPGSTLELPNLEVIIGSSAYDAYLDIQAVNGGTIRLPKVIQINDPPPGDPPGNYNRDNGVRVLSQGFGSVIELPALTAFLDNSAVFNSELKVVRGGIVTAPLLDRLTGVELTIDASSSLPTAQIKQIVRSWVIVQGAALDLSGVTTLTRSRIVLNGGGTANLLNAANVDGASFEVNAGVRLVLPAVTRYDLPEVQSIKKLWRADGPGSTLELPSLEVIIGSSAYDAYLDIQAVNGGNIRLPKVVQINDPPPGDPPGNYNRDNGVRVLSQGFGSVIELPALAIFVDNSAVFDSALKVVQEATVTAPLLDRLTGVELTIDASSWLPTAQIKQIVRSWVIVQGAALDLSGVTTLTRSRVVLNGGGTADLLNAANVDGASFEVNAGVRLVLPAVTRYDLPEVQSIKKLWRADGPGSTLEFPNLPAIIGSSAYDAYLDIQAVNGGTIRLPKVAQINDPPPGDPPGNYNRDNGVRVLSRGFGSVIELPALTIFVDNSAVFNSELEVVQGGSLTAPLLDRLIGVALTVDGSSLIPTAQIKQIVRSWVIAQGAALDLSGVSILTRSWVQLNGGGTANLLNAANVDGSSFVVNAGVRLVLPAVTRYDLPEIQSIKAVWRADGPGSTLEFPNLPAISGSSAYDAYLDIQAVNGGTIRLPNVVQINDPPPGDPPGNYNRDNGVLVLSQGFGSVIDFSGLSSFVDNSQTPNSALTTKQLGAVVVPSAVSLVKVDQSVEPGSLVPPGDADGDGLPNLQEFWADTNPHVADTDSDGKSDLEEVLAGTDPKSTVSKPELQLDIFQAVEIQAVTTPGAQYQFQSSIDLRDWFNQGAPFSGDGKTAHWFSSLQANDKLFFRLKRVQ